MKNCVVTSNRIAQWMLEIEQWELEIQHIKGIDNTLADILSRSPLHYNASNTTNLRQSNQMMVHAIDLNIDNSVKRELENLAILQNTNPRLQAIVEDFQLTPPWERST